MGRAISRSSLDAVFHDYIWHLNDMVEQAGCSATALGRWFRRATGRSPMEHLMHARISKAKEMLADVSADTPMTVTEIAHKLSFPSSQRFATVFKRRVGMTPTQYRTTVGET